MKIMLFNGPPGAGKDSAAQCIYNNNKNIVFERMSMPLKTAFAAITGDTFNEFFELNKYEPIKDKPLELLNGKTYREWQISFSEKFMKPLYGENIFGKLFLERTAMYSGQNRTIVVPDSGFDIEVKELERVFSPNQVLLCRVHRQGCDFSKDSRSYVYSEKFTSLDITNNDAESLYRAKITEIYDEFSFGMGAAELVNTFNETVGA